jgi:Helix-turn-helix domain
MPDEEQSDWISANEARLMLGIGRSKMTALIKSGEVESKPSKLDGRVTLVSRASVEELLRTDAIPKKDALAA